jgi:hypothetical protein
VTASEFAIGTDGFGNHSRNSQRGSGFFDSDMSLTKNFKFGERMGFAVDATAFNVLNHQNFDSPENKRRQRPAGSDRCDGRIQYVSVWSLLRSTTEWSHPAGNLKVYILAGNLNNN